MSVLLIADIINGELSLDQTSKALTGAKMLGEVTILCASKNTSEAANKLSKLEGVKEVIVADDDSFQRGLAEPLSILIKNISETYTHIVAASTAQSKNILPRVAALLDVMIITDVTKIINNDINIFSTLIKIHKSLILENYLFYILNIIPSIFGMYYLTIGKITSIFELFKSISWP